MFTEWLIAAALFLCLLAGAGGWGLFALRLIYMLEKKLDPSQQSPRPIQEQIFLSFVLGTGLLSWSTLLLGLTSLLYTSLVWGLLLIGVGAGLVSQRLPLPQAERSVEKEKTADKGWIQKTLLILCVVLCVGSLFYTFFVNAISPPTDWDEISYHLALAKRYATAHRIVYTPSIVHSNWPMNTEMLFTVGLLLGSDLISHLVTWWMTLWTAWGIYQIGKAFLDQRIGLLAATLYLVAPLIKRVSGTGLIDVSLAFYGTAAILSYARYRDSRSPIWVSLSGLFCGLAAGSKLMGGAYPLILVSLLLIDAFIPPRLDVRSLIKNLLLFGGLGLLMVGPWYARSYAFTGNPLWPFLYGIFGGRNWDWLGHEYHMHSLYDIWTVELPLSLRGVFLSFRYLLLDPFSLGGFNYGLGQTLLISTALSLLFLRRTSRIIYELLAILIAYYAMWFLLVSHQIRFLIPLLPAMTLLGAFAFYAIWDRLHKPALRLILVGLLAFSLGRDFPLVEPDQRNRIARQLTWITNQPTREAFLDRRIDVMPAFRYINTHLPDDAVVLLLPYESRGYYLDRNYIWGHPISQRIIRFEEYDDPQDLAEDLRALGVTHILENPEWIYTGLRYWEHDRALMLALEYECGTQVARWEAIVLYELTGCRD